MNPWLMGDMEDVFNSMKATGRSQFTLEEIQNFVQQASDEAVEKHYQESLREKPEESQLQTDEQQEIYGTLSIFMKENNRQGLELTESDLLSSYRQAKQDTGYFAEQPTSWAQVAEGLEPIPHREQSEELER